MLLLIDPMISIAFTIFASISSKQWVIFSSIESIEQNLKGNPVETWSGMNHKSFRNDRQPMDSENSSYDSILDWKWVFSM